MHIKLYISMIKYVKLHSCLFTRIMNYEGQTFQETYIPTHLSDAVDFVHVFFVNSA